MKLTIPPPTVFKSTMNIGWMTKQSAMHNQMSKANAILKDLKDPDPERYFEELYDHLLLLLDLRLMGDWTRYPIFTGCIETAFKRQRYPFMNNIFTHAELKEWHNS